MRKDGATIDGKTLTIHYTLLENWREQLSEVAAAELPTAKSVAQAMASLGAEIMCPDLAKLGDRPITFATEYRDHKGQLLSSVASSPTAPGRTARPGRTKPGQGE